MSSTIIGLDVSELRTGFAIVEYDSGEPIETGTIHTPRGEDLHARVDAWRYISHAANQTGDIQLVLIEAPWSGPNRQRNVQHAMAVGSMAGICAARLGPTILIDTIQPAHWRRLYGVSTRGKADIKNKAENTLGIRVDQDQADALGIATAAHHIAWNARS